MMKSKKSFLIAGQLALVLGILGFLTNTYFLKNNSTIAFVTGILLGLSLVLNLAFLIIRKM